MRRSHRRANEGEGLEKATGTGPCAGTTGLDVSAGDLSPPTLVESLAKGNLGLEVIARVVISKAVGRRGIGSHPQRKFRNPLRAFYDFRA